MVSSGGQAWDNVCHFEAEGAGFGWGSGQAWRAPLKLPLGQNAPSVLGKSQLDLPGSELLPRRLHFLDVILVAAVGQPSKEGQVALEADFAIPAFLQVLHDPVDGHGVLLILEMGLKQGRREEEEEEEMVTIEKEETRRQRMGT